MEIEMKNEVDFDSLEIGDFFICDGNLYLKIVEQKEGYNVINLSNVKKKMPSLFCFSNSRDCKRREGKIMIY